MSANEITCPVCGAASGEACTNPLTDEPYRLYAPHIERIRAAKMTPAPDPARALRSVGGGAA